MGRSSRFLWTALVDRDLEALSMLLTVPLVGCIPEDMEACLLCAGWSKPPAPPMLGLGFDIIG